MLFKKRDIDQFHKLKNKKKKVIILQKNYFLNLRYLFKFILFFFIINVLRASSAVADPAPLRISSKDHPLVWEMIVVYIDEVFGLMAL